MSYQALNLVSQIRLLGGSPCLLYTSKLKTTADNLKDSTCKAEQLANEMAECAEIKELTTAIVNRLIEKIEVSEPQTIDGEKVQNIRIFYKFVGEIN